MLCSPCSFSLRTLAFFFLSLPVFFQITACGDETRKSHAPANETSEAVIDPELKVYLDEYLADAEAAGVAVPEQKVLELKNLNWTDHISLPIPDEGALLGHCQRRNTDSPDLSKHQRSIEILRPDASGKVGLTHMDDVTLKTIVYHELAHCLHDFSGHLHSKGAALMNARLQPARYLSIDELIRDHFVMLKNRAATPGS